MSQEPTRWSERSDLPELSEAIHAARGRVPDPALLEKMLASVEAAAVAPAAAAAATKATLGAKLALGAAGLGIAGATAWLTFATPTPAPVRPAPRAVPSVVAPAPTPAPSTRLVPQPELPSSVQPSRVPSGLTALPAKPKPPAAASASSSAAPPTELELIREARGALGSDPARALALTQQHARLFPGGALTQEREVLAIESLSRLGQTAQARKRAESFAAAHPESAYVPRLERAVGALRGGEP
jgi:hypothetical protein